MDAIHQIKSLSILYFLTAVLSILITPGTLRSDETVADLTKLSIEELMNIEVTSVSKTEEPQFDAPAAIYVITGEDIRRMGVRTIPDALRIVPGVEVVRQFENC